jgi:hypothetical protein
MGGAYVGRAVRAFAHQGALYTGTAARGQNLSG